jgi:hypothetical protein
MRRRLLESLGVAAVLIALGMLLQVSAVPVVAQAPADRTAAGTGPAPKTAWGHPDLQGIWLDEFDTPLERPAQYANREFLTEQERAALDEGRREPEGNNYSGLYTSVKPTARRTSLVVDPANGRIPALTPQAQERNRREQEFRMALLQNTETCKRQLEGCKGGSNGPPSPRLAEVAPYYNTVRINRHKGPEDLALGERCMGGATPDFNGFRRIVQGPDSIAIAVDTGQGQGYQRVVYLSGSHPPSHIRLRHGDSRGRFEGNTLVVETTNFSPKFLVRGAWENLKLVERFTRVDADSLEYAVTYNDPTVWTAPWTAMAEMTMQSDEQNRFYAEPRCHEGNYGLPALLIGARLDEQAFKEGRGPDPRSQDTATDFGGGGHETDGMACP